MIFETSFTYPASRGSTFSRYELASEKKLLFARQLIPRKCSLCSQDKVYDTSALEFVVVFVVDDDTWVVDGANKYVIFSLLSRQ